MKRRADLIRGAGAALGLVLLILDSQTVLDGAREGVELCIWTVIPSLFPFIILSMILTGALIGRSIPFLKPLCRVLRVPEGASSILAAGLLGGYPVGAQCINQAYESGALDARDAKRMLAFCNNCGPGFVFGMTAGLFGRWWAPWALWGIHIVSALAVGMMIPGQSVPCRRVSGKPITFMQALNRTIRVMGGVCGWVVIFRVLIIFLEKWTLWWLPMEVQIGICGLLELSNGCTALYHLENEGLQFMLCAAFLGFGGLCVGMQTISVTAALPDRSLYFPGKVVQGCLSVILASFVQLGFECSVGWGVWMGVPVGICIIFCLFLMKAKNNSGILAPIGV